MYSLTHLSRTKITVGEGAGAQAHSAYDGVFHILESGLPYTPFTRGPLYNFLQTTAFPTVSVTTFQKYAHQLAGSTLDKMMAVCKGQVGHWAADSTPADNHLELVSLNFYFSGDDDNFEVMPLGVRRVVGSLTGEAYSVLLGKSF